MASETMPKPPQVLTEADMRAAIMGLGFARETTGFTEDEAREVCNQLELIKAQNAMVDLVLRGDLAAFMKDGELHYHMEKNDQKRAAMKRAIGIARSCDRLP